MTPSILKIAALLVLVLLPARLSAADYLQMLNSYVSMKLHLSHSNGQMVGAAWLRIKNNTGAPLSEIPFVLNPGLNVVRATTGSGSPLSQNSATADVTGYEYLQATVGMVMLPSAVAPDGEAEVVIHYRGTLQAIDWAGIEGASETLNPDFTIIRARNFGYPVIAAPNKRAIEAAINQPAYYQTATIELPAGYSVAGNLMKGDRTTGGSNDKLDLKSDAPMKAMTLPIGIFDTYQKDGMTLNILKGLYPDEQSLLDRTGPQLELLNSWFGAPKNTLHVTYVPSGYGQQAEAGYLMLEDKTIDQTTADNIKKAVNGLWGLDTYTAGAWDTGLKAVVNAALQGADTRTEKEKAFADTKALVSSSASAGKTAVSNLSNAHHRDVIGTLMFWILYDRLGHDGFMAEARLMRNELPNSASGYLMLSDVILEESSAKTSKKLAKNWLEKGKLGKDIKKASSFADLAKRY